MPSEKGLFDATEETKLAMMRFPEVQEEASDEEEACRKQAEREELATQLAAERDAQWDTRLNEERAQVTTMLREEYEERLQERIETEHSSVVVACNSFAKARERYFAEIEREVVQLSLAIAARVLQREVAMDPTLLAGVVRVALEKLADASGAALHVSAEAAALWQKAMKPMGLRVEADVSLRAGEVQLHTTAGVAELGIEAQLVEIEQGFFDLMAKRPA